MFKEVNYYNVFSGYLEQHRYYMSKTISGFRNPSFCQNTVMWAVNEASLRTTGVRGATSPKFRLPN